MRATKTLLGSVTANMGLVLATIAFAQTPPPNFPDPEKANEQAKRLADNPTRRILEASEAAKKKAEFEAAAAAVAAKKAAPPPPPARKHTAEVDVIPPAPVPAPVPSPPPPAPPPPAPAPVAAPTRKVPVPEEPLQAACIAIKTANPAARDGVYAIQVEGGDKGGRRSVVCDMQTDGGGWTLVARGKGGETEGWKSADALNVERASQTDAAQGGTFKFSDDTINAIRGRDGIYRVKADGIITATRFFKAARYEHDRKIKWSEANAHNISYSNPVTWSDVKVASEMILTNFENNQFKGLTDDQFSWNTFVTTHVHMDTGEHMWFLGRGQAGSPAGFCIGKVPGCNFTMWVR